MPTAAAEKTVWNGIFHKKGKIAKVVPYSVTFGVKITQKGDKFYITLKAGKLSKKKKLAKATFKLDLKLVFLELQVKSVTVTGGKLKKVTFRVNVGAKILLKTVRVKLIQKTIKL
jgi:hypothetical protein